MLLSPDKQKNMLNMADNAGDKYGRTVRYPATFQLNFNYFFLTFFYQPLFLVNLISYTLIV